MSARTLGIIGVILLVALAAVGWRLQWFGSTQAPAPAAATSPGGVPLELNSTTAPQDSRTTVASGALAPSETPATEVQTVAPTVPTASGPGSQTTLSPPAAPTATKKSPSELRAEALSTLESVVSDDVALDPIRGQWVAQLASKTEGIVDKTQQATPFTVPQILGEVNRFRANPEYGSLVRVVHQGDWAKSSAGPTPMWVTFADINAASRDEVVSWCKQHFSQRGDALLNVCYPRQMNPK